MDEDGWHQGEASSAPCTFPSAFLFASMHLALNVSIMASETDKEWQYAACLYIDRRDRSFQSWRYQICNVCHLPLSSVLRRIAVALIIALTNVFLQILGNQLPYELLLH